MSDKYYEDPLESLLDEQSDEEFGMPEIRDKHDHGASEEKHGNLKTWTAEDFSSIYVRFYPHLVRHAKRYLSNDVQAEEVVQDAFLYMLTALPEIDTELGVLKFMKWKVRLLALDVIRASPNRKETLVDSFDDEQSTEETDIEIERADDMAVIGAALAKLNPRHREALIATVYEEKSSAEVAAQMQLSENATRQLVFRARAAFRKALIGESEVAGKSVSEILSIAAKRAARNAKENVVKIGIFVGILGMALSSGSLIQNSNYDQNIQAIPGLGEIGASESLEPQSLPSIAGQQQSPSQVTPEESSVANPGAMTGSQSENGISQEQTSTSVESVAPVSASGDSDQESLEEGQQVQELETPETQSNLVLSAGVLSSKPRAISVVGKNGLPSLGEYVVEIAGPNNMQALVSLDPVSLDVVGAVIIAQTGGEVVYGYPASYGSGSATADGRTTKTVIARDLTFLTAENNVVGGFVEEHTSFALTIEFDHRGKLMFGSFAVSEI